MIIYRNSFLPVKGFSAFNFCGVILFVRKGAVITERLKNHKKIHSRQMFEMLIVVFYLRYLLEWFVKLFKYRLQSYYNVSFEREAYRNEMDLDYLRERKIFAWVKLI